MKSSAVYIADGSISQLPYILTSELATVCLGWSARTVRQQSTPEQRQLAPAVVVARALESRMELRQPIGAPTIVSIALPLLAHAIRPSGWDGVVAAALVFCTWRTLTPAESSPQR